MLSPDWWKDKFTQNKWKLSHYQEKVKPRISDRVTTIMSSSCRSAAFSASRTKRGVTSCPSRAAWRRWNQDGWWWAQRRSPWVTSGSIRTASSRTRYCEIIRVKCFSSHPTASTLSWSLILCVLCSCPKRWAFKWWATWSREPRLCCGQRPGSLSRPGRPRWEASSPAWPSLAWSWMSKVWYSSKCTGEGGANMTFNYFF